MNLTITFRLLDSSELTLGLEGGSYSAGRVNDRTVDLRRYWAVPGLVDAHGHLIANNTPDMLATDPDLADIETMRSFATAQLEGGVLLMVDKGSKTNATLAMLDFPENERPALEMAGRIFAPDGGYFSHFPVSVSDAELEKAVTRACETTPAQWIKIVGDWPRKGVGPRANYTEDALAAAVAVAHGHGRRVAIHTMAPDVPSMAVRAGIDSIEHGLFLSASDIRALGERHGIWVPTIAAMEGIVEQLGATSSGGKLILRGLANIAEVLPGARGAGVHVLGGTDIVLAHGAVAQEGPRLVEYGLSDAEAVDVLTTAGYRALGRSVLTAGAPADITLFDRNPLLDVTELQHPVAVLRCGEWRFAPDEIRDAFGVASDR